MSIYVEMDHVLSLIEKARCRVEHQRAFLRSLALKESDVIADATTLLRTFESRLDTLCKQHYQLKLSMPVSNGSTGQPRPMAASPRASDTTPVGGRRTDRSLFSDNFGAPTNRFARGPANTNDLFVGSCQAAPV